ncbi:mucin-17 [Betta splendens]|uniref:Mucin-17 n=1 Tax=Betta splendens TaxID=158456 RepID=A0A6P7KU05_BETSP|nr:mucin-17 [Betta splendens]XP_028985942.1 mucin-17 [Betta splendens]
MDSQLASVLTSGSLDVQNGSQCAEASGPVADVYLNPKDKTSAHSVPGNLQPCPVKAAVTIRKEVSSINGKKPEGGGTSKPASQETSKIGGLRQPITVKAGVPVVRSRPIRIKIVVPSRCKRPIANSANSLTKDFAHSRLRPVLVSAGPVIAEKKGKIQIAAVKTEGTLDEVGHEQTGEPPAESFHEGQDVCTQKHVLDAKLVHIVETDNAFKSRTNADKIQSQCVIKEESAEREAEGNVPLPLVETSSTPPEVVDEEAMEEQTEPLDLSLPKKRESRDRRCGRFLDDSGAESSLIMEVDEYEGEGDRDVVEEDEDDLDRAHTPGDSAFFSTSLLTSLSSTDCDPESLLLIDDQGIPYTLSPDGLKVPQVHASASETPRGDAAVDGSLNLSVEDALDAPSDDFYPPPSPAAGSSSLSAGQQKAPDVPVSLTPTPDSSNLAPAALQQANAAPPPSSGPGQPIQILTSSPASTPILLLSSSSSPRLPSTPVGLSLPLSVTQPSPGASAPMFLLLSSVPTAESTSTSTQIAFLDPSTGHLSQISAASASASVSFPLSSGQVSALGPPLPTLSHPVIRLSANNPPVILSGVANMNSGSVAVASCAAAPTVHAQINSSDSNPGTEAIPADEVSNPSSKPSAPAAACDPSAQPGSDAEARSPASDSKLDPSDFHSEHLPLDDHLYFSSTAPSPPPIGAMLSSGQLEPLSPLDPLSPAGSPGATGSRRVLYCQLCPRVFFYLSDLERHAITHSQKKPHVCQQCGKAFKRSSHLQRHKHIHTGQRNFVCPICTKRFREAGELQRHQRVHTGEKPYQCQLCHTRFAERNTLRRHTKRKHPYHQVAMEMLSERRDGGGGGGAQEEEESAEWYSSTVSNLENSESEMES